MDYSNFLHVNLLAKYSDEDKSYYKSKFQDYSDKLQNFFLKSDEYQLKVGSIIEFTGGYYNNIRYTTEVLGFDNNGIYVLWDCYWFPIKHDEVREIIVINSNYKPSREWTK